MEALSVASDSLNDSTSPSSSSSSPPSTTTTSSKLSITNLSHTIHPHTTASFLHCPNPKKPSAVLHSVSFSASSSELLAIVGPSGAGKSTLLRPSQFDTSSISLNDRPIPTPAHLRSLCGFVTLRVRQPVPHRLHLLPLHRQPRRLPFRRPSRTSPRTPKHASRTTLVLALKPLVKGLMKMAGLHHRTLEIEPGTVISIWAPKEKRKGSTSSQKPAVMLLHAFVADGTMTWLPQVVALTKKYDVYVPDLLFFGGSTTSACRRRPRLQPSPPPSSPSTPLPPVVVGRKRVTRESYERITMEERESVETDGGDSSGAHPLQQHTPAFKWLE